MSSSHRKLFESIVVPPAVEHSRSGVVRDSRLTYARELGTAVTALGDSTALLDVKKTEVTTGGLDHPGLVGPGVVARNHDWSALAGA